MTDAERELKAIEITAALRDALPGEPPRALAILCLRVATLLRAEAAMPAPEPNRRRFRLTTPAGPRGTVRDEPRVFKIGGRR
jgi:hypothetical protein